MKSYYLMGRVSVWDTAEAMDMDGGHGCTTM